MADPVANTYTVTQAVGERESLANIIARVDPVDTPMYSNLAKTRAKSRIHRWQEWKIGAPETFILDADIGVWALLAAYSLDDVILHNGVYYKNIQAIVSSTATEEPGVGATWPAFWTTTNVLPPYRREGEDFDDPVSDATPNALFLNVTSIFWEAYLVSGTLQAVDVAGRANELAWQRIIQGLEVKRNVELAILKNQVNKSPEPRRMAGLPTWADGGDGTVISTVTPAHDNVAVEASMQDLVALGAFADTLLMAPGSKKLFSASVQAASAKNIESAITDREMAKWGNGAVSIYLTDLGPIQVVIDRFISADVSADFPSFLFDSNHIRIAEIAERVFAEQILGPTGDAHKRMIVWSGTLEVTSPGSVTIPT